MRIYEYNTAYTFSIWTSTYNKRSCNAIVKHITKGETHCFIHCCGIQYNAKLFCIPFDLQTQDVSRNIHIMERIVGMRIIRKLDMQRNSDMQT